MKFIVNEMASGDRVTTTAVYSTDFTNTSGSFGPTNASVLELNATKIYREWLMCEIITICLVIILVYVIITLSVYQIRKSPYSRTRGERALRSSKRNDALLTGFTMAAVVCTFLRCFGDVDTIWGRYSDINCTYLKKPKIATAFVALMFEILTYWLRQRIIYANKQLRHIVNRVTRFGSVLILGALAVLFFAGLLYFMIQDVGYRPLPPYGCSESTNIVPFALVAVTIFLSQITLVLLLVYPILKRQHNTSIKGRGKQKKLMRLVWKAFLTALVAVVTNLAALLIVAFVPTQVDDIGMFVVDVNLTILVFCTILSNADCKRRLFPFHKVQKNDFIPSSAASARSSSSLTSKSAQNINKIVEMTLDHSEKSSEQQDGKSDSGVGGSNGP